MTDQGNPSVNMTEMWQQTCYQLDRHLAAVPSNMKCKQLGCLRKDDVESWQRLKWKLHAPIANYSRPDVNVWRKSDTDLKDWWHHSCNMTDTNPRSKTMHMIWYTVHTNLTHFWHQPDLSSSLLEMYFRKISIYLTQTLGARSGWQDFGAKKHIFRQPNPQNVLEAETPNAKNQIQSEKHL